MKDVYIVMIIISNTVEVNSVFWNEKKAKKRADEIIEKSDGVAYVLKKWVNPKIVLSAKEYTLSRVAKLKAPLDFPLIAEHH